MEQLKNKRMWVCWQRDSMKGKVPVNAMTGGGAMSNNPQTWADYQTAHTASTRYSGMGLMFWQGIGGIDIDAHHADENELAKELLELFKDTYIEKSPSGNGYHVIFKVDYNQIPTVDGKWDSRYYKKNPKNEVECYIGGFTNRFFTYTGNVVSHTEEVTDQTENVLYFLNKYMLKENKTMATDILERARAAKNGSKFTALYDYGDTSVCNNDDSSADLALCSMLAFWLYEDGGEKAIDEAFRGSKLYRPKWEREDYRTATIQKGIERCGGEFHKKPGRPRKNGQKPTQQDDRERLTIEALDMELKEMGITVRHNVIANAISVEGYGAEESPEHILSTLPTLLYSKLCDKYKGVNQQIIGDYLLVIATRNRFNPVLDVLNGIKWDGKNHLQRVYDALCIDPDDTLSKTLILKWFWQGHALLRNNPLEPYGADGILTLAGGQGIGKTSFFRKVSLSPKFFREGQSIDNYDKDSKRRCVTTWIAELGEVDTTLKADMGMLKAFITNAYDEYRLPYGRVDQQNPRRTNLAATVNDTKFLIDPTGNRRFWTVPLKAIDLDQLQAINAYQVWAQVWEQYARKNIGGFRLTKDEQKALEERNSQCEKAIKGEDEVLDILDDFKSGKGHYEMGYITVSDFKAEHESLKNYSVKQIGMVLDKVGIPAERKTIDGRQQRARHLPKRVYNGGY